MSDPQLMSYFKFDDADLQANRNGQLTEKQKGRLVKENRRDKTWSVIGGGFLSSSACLAWSSPSRRGWRIRIGDSESALDLALVVSGRSSGAELATSS